MSQGTADRVEDELDEEADNTAPIRHHDNKSEAPDPSPSPPNCSLSPQSMQHVRKILLKIDVICCSRASPSFLHPHFQVCCLLSLLSYAVER